MIFRSISKSAAENLALAEAPSGSIFAYLFLFVCLSVISASTLCRSSSSKGITIPVLFPGL